MTTKPKSEPTVEDQAAAEPAAKTEPAPIKGPLCGAPHVLPVLADHVTCGLAAGHKDPEQAKPDDLTDIHEAQDGEAHYTWT